MKVKLNSRERRVLAAIDMDARQSNTSIAKKAGISKEMANYTIKALEDKGIIEGYYSVVDVSRIGYIMHRLFVNLYGMSTEKEAELIDYLRKCRSVGWVVSVMGNWDLAVIFWNRNPHDFNMDYHELMKRYGGYMKKRRLSIITSIHSFGNTHVHGMGSGEPIIIGSGLSDFQIDQIDRRVLGTLSENSRMPTVQIAKAVGVSPNTVKNRIRKLKKTGIIKAFRPKIDSSKLGFNHYKVMLWLDNMAEKDSLVNSLKEIENVIYITEVIGESDIEFEAMFQEDTDLNSFLKELRQNRKGIKDFEIIRTFHVHQINHLPGK